MVYWIEIYCSTPVNIPPLWRAQLALAQSTVCIQYYITNLPVSTKVICSGAEDCDIKVGLIIVILLLLV